MRIERLKINNFGKLKDKDLEFSGGINLIYGENESGKSTVHTFIRSMLFGMERGRGRAAAGDTFSQYEPWENPAVYSGRLKFQSGGKSFWISRSFSRTSKKAEMFCEDDGEELSVGDGDLHMILGELTETVYDNTVSVGQMKVQPGQTLASQLRNYAANYYASGNGEMDLSAALDRLNERKRQINAQIREEIEEKQQKRERIEQESSYVWRDVHRIQEETESLEETIAQRREQEEQTVYPDNRRVIDELRPARWRIHPIELIVFAIAVAAVWFLVNRPWNYLVSIVLVLLCVIYIWNRMKVGKKQEKTEPERILEEIMPEDEKVPLERLLWEVEHKKQELKEKQIQYENLREQLQEMDEMSESYLQLEHQREAVELAQRRIRELSAELQKQVGERMNFLVSGMVREMTGEKYSHFSVGEDLQISLLQDGKKIPLSRLSRGTVEQVYLALRVACSDLLYGKEFPLILDDTFAYYDDDRLFCTLKWLAGRGQQILIFTCQRREEDLLKKTGAPYRKIEITEKMC